MSKILMENKMFNQTGGPTSRERSFLKDVEMQNFHPVASVRELRKMYPDPAPRQYANSGITAFPFTPSAPAANSSMTDVASKKGRKAATADQDEMGDIRQVRRSDRVADSVAAKAAKAASELAMKEWAKEIEKVAKEVRNDRSKITAMIRKKFADATYDELVFDSALAKEAGERFAMLALEEMIAEKVDEQIEEEKEETEEIRRLRMFLDKAPREERESPVVQDALEKLELATGIMFDFSNGNATPKVLTREEIVLRAGEKGLPVPPLTDKDIAEHKSRYGPMYGVGGRRRKTKKTKKSRRKSKRGSGEEPKLDANGNLINSNPPKKGGRRKTKRRTTRR